MTSNHPAGPPAAARPRALDVRPVLAEGREPFQLIMDTVESLERDEVLVLRSPFEPVPLHGVLGGQGFAHRALELAPDDWETTYWRDSGGAPGEPEADATGDGEVHAADGLLVLDVRGLRPPEPMERTLAALERMPHGARLLQINERVPVFLLPLLDERGYAYSVGEDERGTLVTIWREETAA